MRIVSKIVFVYVLVIAHTSKAMPPSVPGEYVVKFKQPAVKSDVRSLGNDTRLSRYGLRVKKSLDKRGLTFLYQAESRAQITRSLGLTESSSEERIRPLLVNELKNLSDIELVEPNYIYTATGGSRSPTPAPSDPEERLPSVVPNESLLKNLWGLRNSGQADSGGRRGVIGADIDANNAWALSQGSKNVVVAVIDSGIDYNHPDLKANMWSMPGRPDVHGYNAINDSLDPMDDRDHGTHCAGSIGAVGDNGRGIVGVNWNVSLMAIKFLSSSGSGTLANAVKGIDWAREHGAQIMSNSWGGSGFSQILLDAIRNARNEGILFVVAAGNTNGGNNNDENPTYPASYNVDNILSVAATNNLDQLASFSHYGARTVHIAAPGENIFSTLPSNSYGSKSGTSMATPHVAGAAALLLAKEPRLSYLQLKERLLKSADRLGTLKNKVQSGGRLNVYKALANIDSSK